MIFTVFYYSTFKIGSISARLQRGRQVQAVTVAPSFASSSSLQEHVTLCLENLLMISWAMSSKFSVAKARMVGPAPVSYTHLDVYKRQEHDIF